MDYRRQLEKLVFFGGTHLVELLQFGDTDCREIAVTLDEKLVIETTESKDWDHGYGSTGGGQFANCMQLPPDEPVVLFRRRFHYEVKPGQTTTPQGPTEGLLLWIERVSEKTGKAETETTSGAD